MNSTPATSVSAVDSSRSLSIGRRNFLKAAGAGLAASLAPMLSMAGIEGVTDEWFRGDLYSYELKTVDLPRLQQLQEWCRQFLAAVDAGWLPDRG